MKKYITDKTITYDSFIREMSLLEEKPEEIILNFSTVFRMSEILNSMGAEFSMKTGRGYICGIPIKLGVFPPK